MDPVPPTTLRRATSGSGRASRAEARESVIPSSSGPSQPSHRRSGSVSGIDVTHALHLDGDERPVPASSHDDITMSAKVEWLMSTVDQLQNNLGHMENKYADQTTIVERHTQSLTRVAGDLLALRMKVSKMVERIHLIQEKITATDEDMEAHMAEVWNCIQPLVEPPAASDPDPLTPLAGPSVPVRRVAAPVTVPLAPVPVARDPTAIKAKPTLPKPFDGTPAKFYNFLAHCQHVFFLYPSTYPSDVDKVGMIMTLLEGPAMTWGTKHMVDRHPMLFDLSLFIEHFTLAFAEKGRVERSGNELKNLRMGASLQDYVIKFRELQAMADCNDAMLQICFRDGLSKELRRLLVSIHQHPNVESLISHAFAFDVALEAERLAERRGQWSQGAPQPPVRPYRADNRAAPGVVPQPGAVRPRGPLSQEERTRRRLANLCLFCGDGGHVVSNCPIAPPRPAGWVPPRRGRVAAMGTITAEEQENE